MRYVVALTGGIGSGKSTIANIFARFGVNIIDADIIARQMVKLNTFALHAIATRFGNSVLNNDGTLNRRILRERIFINHTEKTWLNALLHPLIYQESQRQILKTTSHYALWVVPLLIETQIAHKADRVLVVDVLPEIQIQRITLRDNITSRDAERILSTQVTREIRLAIADDIIENNGKLNAIAPKVACLHFYYMSLAKKMLLKKSYNKHLT